MNELYCQLPVFQDSCPQAHVRQVIRPQHVVTRSLGVGHGSAVIPPPCRVVVQVESQSAREPRRLAGGRSELNLSGPGMTGFQKLRYEMKVTKHRTQKLLRRLGVNNVTIVLCDGHGRLQGKGIVLQREGPDRKVAQARHENGGSKTASQ